MNAAAFLIGWSVSLVFVFAVTYALGGDRASQHGGGRLAVDVVEILLGVALVALAARQCQRRNDPARGRGLQRD